MGRVGAKVKEGGKVKGGVVVCRKTMQHNIRIELLDQDRNPSPSPSSKIHTGKSRPNKIFLPVTRSDHLQRNSHLNQF